MRINIDRPVDAGHNALNVLKPIAFGRDENDPDLCPYRGKIFFKRDVQCALAPYQLRSSRVILTCDFDTGEINTPNLHVPVVHD